MTSVLVDINIVLDLLAKRSPFYQGAALLFSLANEDKVKLSVSVLTIANTNYVLNRHSSASKTKEILRKVKLLFTTHALTDKIIDLALNDNNFKDYEDGLQYYTALENNLEVIVSRKLKGFKKSSLPVMTADEFLKSVSLG